MSKHRPLNHTLKPSIAPSSWFDKFPPWKKDLFCILLLYVLLLFMFKDIVFKGMIFSDSGDTAAHESWVRAIEHIEQTEDVEPLWIPYIFSGMPLNGTMIFPREVNYIQGYVVKVVGLSLFFGADFHWMIMPYLIMGVSMFYFARLLKFSHFASLIAALTVMLNPYAIGLPETGHGSKLVVLGYIPVLFLVTYLLFTKRNVLFLGLLAGTVSTMLLSRHPQISFYGLLLIGCYFLYEIIFDVKNKRSTIAVKKGAMLVIALLIGFATYAYHFLPTQEYAQYSIRGGGETNTAGGLGYDYATNWSFHPFEIMNFVLPSFMGIVPHPENWQEDKAYWGWMPFTNSTLYIGLVPLLLSIVAIIYQRNAMTWFLLLFSVFVFFIAFGKHLPLIYDLMFNYFPYFNKFRVPVMILHLIPITFGLLAASGLTFLTEKLRSVKEFDLQRIRKRLTIVIIGIGIVLIVGMIFNDAVYSLTASFLFQKDGELQQYQQQYGTQSFQVLSQLKKFRFELFWKDYIKFALIASGCIGLIILFIRRKVQQITLNLGLICLLIIDLLILDFKYINPKSKSGIVERFQSDNVIQRLQAERDTSQFRVFPVRDVDQENLMMYNVIQSVEGYSPAKLKIYQELRDSALHRFNPRVIDMLNVKYLVGKQQSQDGRVQTVLDFNPSYLPRAWFVDTMVISKSKSETFAIMNSPQWNPKETAILEEGLPLSFGKADSASVSILKYSSRLISMNAYSSSTSLLVLSEIFYPAGWKAYVDNKETQIYKTNHVLRSIIVPEGNHTIEYRYAPDSYDRGYTLSQSAWGLTLVLILIGVIQIPQVRERLGFKKTSSDSVTKA